MHIPEVLNLIVWCRPYSYETEDYYMNLYLGSFVLLNKYTTLPYHTLQYKCHTGAAKLRVQDYRESKKCFRNDLMTSLCFR